MLRRRDRAPVPRRLVAAFAAAGLLLAALALGGCGRDDFENDPRPPVPAEISAKIGEQSVAVSPREFGAGLVNLTVANLTTEPGALVIRGPVNAETSEIPPAGATTLKLEMKTGAYEASADGIAANPANFTVGAERPSGQHDLLLP
jgi:hypothetical protein